VRQKEPLGNGHAILAAKDIIGDEPFLVMWGDEFFVSDPPTVKQLIEAYEKYGTPAIAAVRIDQKDLSKYGIADIEPVENNIFKIRGIVEKPAEGEAPSNLATHGNYLFTPDIFDSLEKLKPGKNGEIWIIDAIVDLIKKRDVYAVELANATYYDCGNKVSYLQAVIDHGLAHDDTQGELREYLKNLKL